jgi:outer membrane protein TolC
VGLQRINYNYGVAAIPDLLDAQQEYLRALLGYVEAEAQSCRDTVLLSIAIGGVAGRKSCSDRQQRRGSRGSCGIRA